MAPANYHSKKELAKIGLEGFAILDEHNYGRGRNGGRPFPNYGGLVTYIVTSRPLPPPAAAAATPFVASNHYSTASSGGYSRRHQYQGYNYCRYSPAESHVGWAPAATMTTETATVVCGGYEAGDADILMDNYKY